MRVSCFGSARVSGLLDVLHRCRKSRLPRGVSMHDSRTVCFRAVVAPEYVQCVVSRRHVARTRAERRAVARSAGSKRTA